MTHIRFGREDILGLSLVAVTAIVAGIAVVQLDFMPWSTMEAISLLGVLFLALLPILRGYYFKNLDPFEPVYLVCAMTIISFVIAPSLLLARGEIINSGVDYRSEALEAILLGGLALLGFFAGYYLLRGRRQNQNERRSSTSTLDPRLEHNARRWAFAGILVVFLFLVIWFRLANIPLALLNALSADSNYGLARTLAETNILYFYTVRASLPALLLLSYPVLSPARWHKLAIGMLWILTLIFFVSSGGRGITFRLLLATLVYLYLVKRRRPALRTILAAVLILLVLAGSLVALRSRVYADIGLTDLNLDIIGNLVERDLTDSGGAAGMMILLRVFPEKTGFVYGEIFRELLYSPIPRALWPDKPVIRGVQTLAEQYVPRSHSPPIFGLYYAGFGIPGVILSMAVFGVISAWIYSVWQRGSFSSIHRVTLAVWMSLMWELYHRGGATWATVNILFSLGPILAVNALAKVSQCAKEKRIRRRSSVESAIFISDKGEVRHV